MATTKLTEFDQAIHIQGGGPARGGICYYICEYVEKHMKSPWASPESFADAKVASTRLRTVPLVAAGKAANAKHRPQEGGYTDSAPLSDNYLYRVWLGVGAVGVGVNHETMMLTGVNEIILFDPNWGFYHVDSAPAGHAAKFEQTLTNLYATIGNNVGSFGYKRKQRKFR